MSAVSQFDTSNDPSVLIEFEGEDRSSTLEGSTTFSKLARMFFAGCSQQKSPSKASTAR